MGLESADTLEPIRLTGEHFRTFQCVRCGAARDQKMRRTNSIGIKCPCGSIAVAITDLHQDEKLSWWIDKQGNEVYREQSVIYSYDHPQQKVPLWKRILHFLSSERGGGF